jgi:hypothetical protein
MEDPSNANASLSASDSKKWIVRIALALLLGQAIWGMVTALTGSLLVPLIARVMGSDPNSPLYLGKGTIDVPAVFVSMVEFCLAGIVAVMMNSWVQKGPRVVRRKVMSPSAGSLSLTAPPVAPAPVAQPQAPPVVAAPPVQAVSMVQAAPVQAVPAVQAPPSPPSAVATAPSKPAQAPAPPTKPKKPKEVYYNIVGEPISMDDE